MNDSADGRPNTAHGAGQTPVCPPIEVVTIGDEILSGTIVDTNSSMIALKLASVGLEIKRMSSVGDSPQEIIQELRQAASRARAVIVTGGLGPTQDDRTSQAAADAFGRALVLDQDSLLRLKEFFQRLGLEMSPNNERQAWMPEGSRVIPNPMGTAPGFALEEKGCLLVFLPGVPRELERMLEESVLKLLVDHVGPGMEIRSRTLKIFGLAEAKIDQMVRGLLDGLPGVSLASLPHYPENRLRITVRGQHQQEVEMTLRRAEVLLQERIGSWVYGVDDDEMETVVVRLLRAKGETLAVAESCTGGLLAHRLTNVPGASEVFGRGYVAYSAKAKEDLGVQASLIQEHGQVSALVAEAMAQAAAARAGSSLALSVTGVAGPTGGNERTPVGTVYIGLAAKERVWSQRFWFRGGRGNVKTLASSVALDWLRRFLLGEDPSRYAGPWR